MNQIIEKDVIKGLECCAIEVKNLFDDELPCKDCPYLQKPCRQLIKDAYNLINRQQHQLDNYSHNVRTLTKESLEFMKTIKKQQEEIEIYEADCRRLVNSYKQCAYERDVLLEENNQMTDKEIIKGYCSRELCPTAKVIINRQQAEINRQKAEIEKLQLSRKQKLKEIERLKAEARAVDKDLQELDRPLIEIRVETIKEFVNKLLINLEYDYCS